MAERALAEADQADGRRAAGDERPLLGVPVAVKDNMDVAGELTTHGTGCLRRARHRRRRDRAPPARGGRGDPRQDQPARAGDHRRHGVAQLGRHPQPVGHRAHAGWLERRQRRGGGGRPGAAGARHGRRRLDPHPGRLLRAVRPQAPARARLAHARRPALARHERGRRGHADRGRQRAVPGRASAALPRATPTPRRRPPARSPSPPPSARQRCGWRCRSGRPCRCRVAARCRGGACERPPTSCARSATA